MSTTTTKCAAPSGKTMPEDTQTETRGPRGYEPQAVMAARFILNNEEPPKDVFFSPVRNFANCWEGFAETALRERTERDREILLIDGYGEEELERALRSHDHPTLRLHAIEQALQECFTLLDNIDRPDKAPNFRNMNLVHGFTRLLFEEMQALMKEWDELTGIGYL